MSVFSEFFNSLFGTGSDASASNASALDTHPCANCPSNCTIAGDACKMCAPYKKKLIDAVYYIDHLDEYYAQYEVTGLSGAASAITCPYCGAQTQNHLVCEYCGSKLAEDSGKIKVSSASDIPNPIMQAQDIIYERYETVIKQYTASGSSDDDGFLSEVISFLTGAEDSDDDSNSLGAKMSEAEIKEAASLYGVSVGEYLTGLDNGKYLTLAGRKAAASMSQSGDYTPAAAGIAGVAGIGAVASLLFRDSVPGGKPGSYHRPDPYRKPDPRLDQARPQTPPRYDQQHANRPDGPRPSQRPGSTARRSDAAPSQRRDPGGDRRDGRPGGRSSSSRQHRSDRNPGGPGHRP